MMTIFLAVFCTGAYGYSMANNYNRIPRPPVVFVENGKARLVVKRETYEDLIRLDLPLKKKLVANRGSLIFSNVEMDYFCYIV